MGARDRPCRTWSPLSGRAETSPQRGSAPETGPLGPAVFPQSSLGREGSSVCPSGETGPQALRGPRRWLTFPVLWNVPRASCRFLHVQEQQVGTTRVPGSEKRRWLLPRKRCSHDRSRWLLLINVQCRGACFLRRSSNSLDLHCIPEKPPLSFLLAPCVAWGLCILGPGQTETETTSPASCAPTGRH